MANSRAAATLLKDFNELKKRPVEGFLVDLPNENDIFTWAVWIQGPPETFYEGGAFKALLKFPQDYPWTPPKLVFTSEVWHPNVYWGGKKAGEVCISILHPPGGNPEMPDECESDSERWNPAHSCTTIILSVISMLSDPNFSSPANIDASVQWRGDLQGYKKKVKETVEKSRKDLPSGFQFPQPQKPAPNLSMSQEELYIDEPLVSEDSGFESIILELENMGFERNQIENAIKKLLGANKKIHQEIVLEKLLE